MLHFFSRKNIKSPDPQTEEGIIYFGEEENKTENYVPEEIELPIDLARHRGAITLRAPMIGAKESDVSVTIKGKEITISKNATASTDEEDLIVQECFWGPLSRTITLDEPFVADKISATLKQGVLTVHIPLLKEKTKIIQVEDEETKDN